MLQPLSLLNFYLQKFQYNETTGEVSNQEVVTELGDKDLAITVKVPGHAYDANKEYIIVREHDNNGIKEMDVLIPEQDGDRLTFKTNKFSSFIIVEVADNYATDDDTTNDNTTNDNTTNDNTTNDNTTNDNTTNDNTTNDNTTNDNTTNDNATNDNTTGSTDDETDTPSEDPEGPVETADKNESRMWLVGIMTVMSFMAAAGFVLYRRDKIERIR